MALKWVMMTDDSNWQWNNTRKRAATCVLSRPKCVILMEKQKDLEIERKSMYVFLNMNSLDVFSRRCVFFFFLMNYRPKCKLNLPFFLTPTTPILVLSPSLRYKGKAKKSNLVPNASFRYKRKAKKTVKIALGTRLF